MPAAAQHCLLFLLLALGNHGPADAMRQARRGPEHANNSVATAKKQATVSAHPSSAAKSATVAAKHAAVPVNASLTAKPSAKPTAEVASASQHTKAPANASSVAKSATVAAKKATAPVNASLTAKPSAKTTAEDVQKLRVKLQVVVEGLRHMLDAKNGTLANAKVAPALQVFIKELHLALVNVSASEDPVVAMRKLKGAESSVNTLVHELSARQESLMLEDESEHESLLLGVLMSKQHEPMNKQIEVLQNSDFAHLPVCKALLAAHNTSKALYLQAADFLDQHKGDKVSTSSIVEEAAGRKDKAEKMAAALSKRVQSMEMEFKAKEASHQKHMKTLADRASSASSKKEKHLAEMLAKREARAFKKFAALRSANIATMKSAVEAVKRGDFNALQRARAALLASLQALRSQNQGFLVLLSLGHRAMGSDCPYCAAQCIEKCRNDGNQYVKCLGVCADAGK